MRLDPSASKTLDLEVREKRGGLDSTQQFSKRSIRPVRYENARSRSSRKAKRFGFDPTFLKSIRFRCAARPIAPEVMKWELPTLLSRTTDVAGRFLFGVGGSGRRPVSPPTPEVRRAGLKGGDLLIERVVWGFLSSTRGEGAGAVEEGPGVTRAVAKPSKTVGISIGGGSACSRGDCGGRVGDFLASEGSRSAFSDPKWVPEMFFSVQSVPTGAQNVAFQSQTAP